MYLIQCDVGQVIICFVIIDLALEFHYYIRNSFSLRNLFCQLLFITMKSINNNT